MCFSIHEENKFSFAARLNFSTGHSRLHLHLEVCLFLNTRQMVDRCGASLRK